MSRLIFIPGQQTPDPDWTVTMKSRTTDFSLEGYPSFTSSNAEDIAELNGIVPDLFYTGSSAYTVDNSAPFDPPKYFKKMVAPAGEHYNCNSYGSPATLRYVRGAKLFASETVWPATDPWIDAETFNEQVNLVCQMHPGTAETVAYLGDLTWPSMSHSLLSANNTTMRRWGDGTTDTDNTSWVRIPYGEIKIELTDEDTPCGRFFQTVEDDAVAEVLVGVYTAAQSMAGTPVSKLTLTHKADANNPRDWSGSATAWTLDITGLIAGRQYRAKWFRTVSGGTSYWEEVVFTAAGSTHQIVGGPSCDDDFTEESLWEVEVAV